MDSTICEDTEEELGAAVSVRGMRCAKANVVLESWAGCLAILDRPIAFVTVRA